MKTDVTLKMMQRAKMSTFTSTKTQQRVCRRWNHSAKWTEQKKEFQYGICPEKEVREKRKEKRSHSSF